jgi:hypothetical protein
MTFWEAWDRFIVPSRRAWAAYIQGVTRVSTWAMRVSIGLLSHKEYEKVSK